MALYTQWPGSPGESGTASPAQKAMRGEKGQSGPEDPAQGLQRSVWAPPVHTERAGALATLKPA